MADSDPRRSIDIKPQPPELERALRAANAARRRQRAAAALWRAMQTAARLRACRTTALPSSALSLIDGFAGPSSGLPLVMEADLAPSRPRPPAAR